MFILLIFIRKKIFLVGSEVRVLWQKIAYDFLLSYCQSNILSNHVYHKLWGTLKIPDCQKDFLNFQITEIHVFISRTQDDFEVLQKEKAHQLTIFPYLVLLHHTAWFRYSRFFKIADVLIIQVTYMQKHFRQFYLHFYNFCYINLANNLADFSKWQLILNYQIIKNIYIFGSNDDIF